MPILLRRIGRSLLPPIVVAILRPLSDFIRPSAFEYIGCSWPNEVEGHGWDSESAAASLAQEAAAFRVSLATPLPFGMDNAEDEAGGEALILHNTLVAAAFVILSVGKNREHFSILDWGGGVGSYYALTRAVLPGVTIEFTVVDLAPFCKRGREVFPEVRFLESHEDDGRPNDLVIASSSLQYARDWRGTLAVLASRAREGLFLHRVPVVLDGPTFVVRQRVSEWTADFVGWHFSREELLEFAERVGLVLKREFLVAERPVVWHAPSQPEYRGFFFRRVSS